MNSYVKTLGSTLNVSQLAAFNFWVLGVVQCLLTQVIWSLFPTQPAAVLDVTST